MPEQDHIDPAIFDQGTTWKMLIVDDEADVHSATRLALGDFEFEGRPLEFISAYSGGEARNLYETNPDIAIVLLDVVMESEHAGLEFARYIREEMGNGLVRIILRTGQPGSAPSREVIAEYDINDYREKIDLTLDRLFSSVYTAMRGLRSLLRIEQSRHDLSRLNQSLEQSNEKLEGFVHMASHDLKAPLRKITARISMLEDALGETRNEEVERCMHSIREQSEYMRYLLESLLRFSQLRESAQSREPVDILEVLRLALDNLEIEVADAGGSIVLPERGAQVLADPNMLAMAFQNLIANSLKFHRPNNPPIVRVHVDRVEDDPRLPGPCVHIRVEDEGIGIPAEHLDHVFEAFVKAADSRNFKGSGLGLNIVRRIVHAHGGVVEAESEENVGTTFHVLLPAH